MNSINQVNTTQDEQAYEAMSQNAYLQCQEYIYHDLKCPRVCWRYLSMGQTSKKYTYTN